MVSAAPAPLSETLSTPLGIGIAIYFLIGFVVAGFIFVRGVIQRQSPVIGFFSGKQRNALSFLFILQFVLLLWPIAFIIELALWPLVLLFLWTYQSDDD
jgi:hypothetical protein